MDMRSIQLVALVVLSACVPGVAYADSDGYYCVGRNYLAYQFKMAPQPVAPHRLYVISTRGPQGIPEPAVLELPQFQVHGMLCGEGWIDVASFTAVYRVTLDKHDRPDEPVKKCEVSITSRIVETNRSGQEISQRIIFQGRGHGECGGAAGCDADDEPGCHLDAVVWRCPKLIVRCGG